MSSTPHGRPAHGSAQYSVGGEGAVYLPGVTALISGIRAKGAPLDMATPEYTTGVEIQTMLSSRNKARQPAASRLFSNYLLSPEGNKVFNDDPGGDTMYDTSRLPRQYESPKANALARRDLVIKLLGF